MIETTLERIAIALEKLVRLKEAVQGKAPLSPEAAAAVEDAPAEDEGEKPKKKRGRKPKAEKEAEKKEADVTDPPADEEGDAPKVTKDEAKTVLSKLMELQDGATDDAFEIIQTKGISKDGDGKPESLGECTEDSFGLIVSTAQAKIKQIVADKMKGKDKKKEDLL